MNRSKDSTANQNLNLDMSRPNILIIVPEQSIYPPIGGGALRNYHLILELAKRYKVHVVSRQSRSELNRNPAFSEVKGSLHFHSSADSPPSPSLLNKLSPRIYRALIYRWERRWVQGPAEAAFLDLLPLVKVVLQKQHIDIVIFEHLEAMTLAPVVKRLSPQSIRILDAHNIDHLLVEQKLQSSPENHKYARDAKRLKEIESNLSRYVDATLTCSNEDRETLLKLNLSTIQAFTVPNGVDSRNKLYDDSNQKQKEPILIFCGSLDYAPNWDGIQWFHQNIWPLIRTSIPEVQLRIVGPLPKSADSQKSLQADQSVTFTGFVEDLKVPYDQSTVSVVPLRMGSGTRLKILEAMAYGCPVVSTTIGSEGIVAENRVEIRIADDPKEFADNVIELLLNKDAYEAQRVKARRLVEAQYDWSLVGDKLCNCIDTLLLRAN